MNKIQNSVVLVTGANRGLGRAFVTQALAMGAAKVYAATRKPHGFNDPRVVNILLDITDESTLKGLAKQAPDVTVLINNAGVFFNATILGADVHTMRTEFETNVLGTIQVAQTMAPVLKQNGGGAMINVHSALSWLPFGSYGASKAALWSVTNSLRQELAEQGTQVVGVHVGLIDTDMAKVFDMPKSNPNDVAQAALEGMERGLHEVLVDEASQYAKSLLSGPVEELHS
jgi:NAD(P)-dependent dehydrogenase (short-subunit alcohol dehydrogenase family)